MFKKILSCLFINLITFSFSISAFSQSNGLDLEFAPNRLILKVKKEYNKIVQTHINTPSVFLGIQEIDKLNAQYHCQKIEPIIGGGVVQNIVLEFKEPINIFKAVEEYLNTEKFEYVEPDYICHGGGQEFCPPDLSPNDIYFSRQWGLKNTGSFTQSTAIAGQDIKADEAWNITTGSSSVVMCIIDSGLKLDHPEVSNRIWQNPKEIAGNGKDDDGNGKIDDINGWDYVNNDNNPTDDHGHGTNVGGIAAATGNNSSGYAGVDWNCKLMIIKTLNNQNSGLYSNQEAAVYYAADNGAKVINMSIVGTTNSNSLEAAINYAWNKGVTVVVCMGNENVGTNRYPAAYNNVIAVGAINPNGKRSVPFFWSTTSGSNYGAHIDVVAPGNYIFGLKYSSNTDFGSYWGDTSQATPFVAGLATLMLAKKPTLTPSQIKDIIQRSCDDLTGDLTEDKAGFDNYYGWGRVNAKKALTVVTSVESLIDESDKLTIFPNPSLGIFTLSSPEILRGGVLEVFDITGRRVLYQKIEDANMNIDMIKQADGVYWLIIQNDKLIMRKKIVKTQAR